MNISFKDFNFICRLCLAKNDFYTDVLPEQENLLSTLGVHVHIQDIEFRKLPQIICRKCEKSIDSIFTFVNQCKASYALLESILVHEKRKINEAVSHDVSLLNNINNDYNQKIEIKSPEADQKTTNENDFADKDANEKFTASKANILCKTCNVVMKSKSLRSHYRRSIECRPHNFKLFTCEICSKEFLSLRDKTEHENIHTEKNPHKCPYCIQEFKFKRKLYKHIYEHKLKLGLVDKREAYVEKRVRLNLKCDRCEKVFASRSGLHHHKLKHDGKVSPKKQEVKQLNKSIKDYLCNYCGMRFYSKANLDGHFRVHTDERPYKCSHCDQQFKTNSVLKRHALSHLEVRPKPFMCDVCRKGFTTKAHMEIHKRLHTGEKPYECQFCKKCFNYRTRWRMHLRIHTGEFPFVCSICDTKYRDKGSLRKHQRKKGHTSEEDSRKFNENLKHPENDLVNQCFKN